MVFWIPLLAGAGAGAVAGWLLGGSKKEQTAQAGTYAPVITYPKAQYSPVYSPTISTQWDYQYAPSVFIESPGSVGATQETKKEATQTPSVTVIPSITPTATTSVDQAQSGDNLLAIALIGAIALGGIYFITKKKK